MRRLYALLLVVLTGVGLGWTSPADSADATAAIKRFEATWASLRSFTSEVSSHIEKGDKLEERTLILWFKRPMNIRTDVLRGNRANDSGSVAVYRGEGTVTGHQGGMLSGINLTLRVDDDLCTSIRGDTITDLLFSRPLEVIHQYQRRRCPIELGPPTQISGRAVTPLILTTTNENFIALNDNVHKDVLYYDAQLQVPVQWERYEPSGRQVIRVTYTNTRLNPDIEDRIFDPRVKVR